MKFVRLIILVLLGLLTFGVTMTFAGVIPAHTHLFVRAGLLAVLGALWLTARGDGAFGRFRPVFFAYFAIVAGLTVAWYATDPIVQALHLGFAPFANAMTKAVQAGLAAVTIIALALASGQSLGSLHLRKGRLALGLSLGLIGFAAFIGLTFLPGGPFLKVASFAKLATVVPAVALFAFTNAFMEELLFRGILLQRIEALTGKWLALIATTLVFALAHVQVNYAAHLWGFVAFVAVLGALWGLLMQKSKGIWGSVLFHAGADVAVILPIYQAMLAGH